MTKTKMFLLACINVLYFQVAKEMMPGTSRSHRGEEAGGEAGSKVRPRLVTMVTWLYGYKSKYRYLLCITLRLH